MPKLPVVSGEEVVKALCKTGFEHIRTKGSHAILNKKIDGDKITIPIPLHNELAKGTLKSIMRQADLSLIEFLKLL